MCESSITRKMGGKFDLNTEEPCMPLNGRENYKSFCKGMSSVVFAMPNTTSIWIVVTISPMKQIIAGHPLWGEFRVKNK